MASRGASLASQSDDQDLELIKDLSDKLYEQCRLEHPDQVWLQEDLFEMNVIPGKDLMLLMKVVQSLCDDKFFKLVAAYGGAAGWKVRTREDAAK
jgi:DNA-directed RNA polymerase III subunit RPC6